MDLHQIIRETVREELANLTPAQPEPKLISTAEAAKILDCSPDTVVALAHKANQNGFPCIWLSSKTLKIDQNRLNQWFAARQGVSV